MADFAPVLRTPPSVVTIARGPENVNSLQVKIDVRNEFFSYMPGASPLVTLTNKLKRTRTVGQRQFYWMTQDEFPRFTDVSAAYTAVATTIVLNAGQGVRVPQFALLQNLRTGEIVLVSSVATDTLTVVRGVGGAGIAGEAADRLQFLGIAAEDGTGKTNFKSTVPAFEYNYTQIVKTAYAFTGRQQNTDLFGGNDVNVERRKQATEHAKSLEKLLWWGRRSLTAGTATTHERSTMGGVDSFVTQTWNVGQTAPTERMVTEVLEFAMTWGEGGNLNGNRRKWLFASNRWITEFEFFGKNKIQETPGSDKVLGMSVKTYKSTHGDIMLVPTHILDESHPDTAFLLDMNHVARVAHQGRDTKLRKNIQENDLDGMEEEYLTDCSLELSLPDAHMKWVGLPVA